MQHFNDARDWFFGKRFGLFVHWGLYAIPAWHEQIQWRGHIPRREYVKLIDQFNPERFDPDAWLDLAEEAEMQYVCFTTKHHDGFCMWHTKLTDFHVGNSPYRRDIVGMLAEACQRRGFPLCLYYSVVDWHHASYPNQNRSHELAGPEEGDEPDLERYLEFLRGQVRELCTEYGPLGGFWWDMNVTERADPSINNLIRSLQPGAVINNRGFDEGDFGTPERDWDDSVNELAAFERPTEACQSVGLESWGYKADEDYYTDAHLIRSLDKVLAKGGNYLLNVGPKADGTIPDESASILRRIGKWRAATREAFEGAEPAPYLTENRDVLLTRRGNTVYVHLSKEPVTAAVLLKPLATMPRSATLLNTGEAVRCDVAPLPSEWETGQPCLRLRNLPVNDLANSVLVVKLEFDCLPDMRP